MTPTFAAIRFAIDNWRWKRVPFYLRSGKRMASRHSEIAIQFRQPPVLMFGQDEIEAQCPSMLVLRVQPNEGVALRFHVKTPGADKELTSHLEISPVDMDFSYAEVFGAESSPAYQTLLLDVMIGDQTLFTRSDEVEAAWRIIDPLLKHWESRPPEDIPTYPAGSMGPPEADQLMQGAHARWR
jgi:glucose-6-phosphate 1-dehydrogenase